MKYLLSILSILICVQLTIAQDNFKYKHILITNDDGIEDVDRLLALAKSVKKVSSRVSIVVSSFDRSGASNYTAYGKYQSTLEVTCEYYNEENSISIYVMPGYPADCVLLGLSGLFHDDKPDLVLSGINSGANTGPGWFRSGTIGAIRTSAFLGVRGIALSGFEDEDERSYTVIPNWITKLISSEIIDAIDTNSYLTIAFPEISLDEIKGIKVANRKVSFDKPESIEFYQVHGDEPHSPENKTVWTLKNLVSSQDTSIKYDEDYLKEGYIVITPMSINENSEPLLNILQKGMNRLPEFSLK